MDTENFIKFLQDTLDYHTTEKLAELIINEAEHEVSSDITQYDKLLWLIRSAFIQGAILTQTGIIFDDVLTDKLATEYKSRYTS